MRNDGEMRIFYLIKNIEKGCGKLYNIVKRNYVKGITYMKPRIFISSTFYDLKYIREDLANFVRSYGYEPVLFEDGDIGYMPGKTLDSSCYESMRNSDMVILIIGGEYGSAASGEEKDEFKEYMSVTRNEFRTAAESGIPIFTMIDKKVMAEYGVYEANYNDIEKENRLMLFPTTKNINVFRFIKEIKGIVTLPIQEFEKSADIKEFISKQWADMFKNYLSLLRNEKENKKIESSVSEMKLLIQKMDIMLGGVGKNIILKENPEEYNEIINQQEVISFCNSLVKNLRFLFVEQIDTIEQRKKFISIILNYFKKKRKIDKDFHMDLFNLLKNNEYVISGISFYSSELEILAESDLLEDSEKFEKIVRNLSEDKYFNELERYESI